LNAKDSILQKFTRVASDGSFSVNNIGKGHFIMIITYPGYADFSEGFTLDEKVQLSHDFGKINMVLKSRLLHDVIVKGGAIPIKVKGDTIEFNAKAYVVQPNDRVEDLIKQFPGIQVDKDGKITAQGEEVKKVLVDGEEFFGDDPTLVTKNIRADMVDKVQLYDKKSDQATFTGIDDGQKTKTLNIKLKENKKNGYFGKVDAGVGNDGYYQLQGMYNKFTAKQKFSAYTTDANTGKTGLSWQDSQKYGDAGTVQVDANGGISLFLSGMDDGLDSFDGRYNNQGLPKATTGGLHYDAKWNKDNETVNANYKIGVLDVDGTKSSTIQNNLTTGAQYSNSDQTFKNSMFRQKLDFTYLVKMDTTSTLKLAVDGTTKHGTSDNDSHSITTKGDTTLNQNSRNSINTVDERIFNFSAFYTKKFKKKGRTLSVLLSEGIDNTDGNGHLKTEADFYNPLGVIDSTQLTDQRKTSRVRDAIFNSNITYTEPLSKVWSLTFNYGLNVNNGSSDRFSYNAAPGSTVYNILDTTYSNSYKLNQLANQIGAIFNYHKGKAILNFGTRTSDVAFKQIDEYTGNVLKRHFINWSPQAMYQYRFSQQQSLYVFYNGNTTQPNINQIQPVKNNNDPVNTYVGNADLTPSFTNRLSANFYSFKVLSGQYINFGTQFSAVSNQIVTNTINDPNTGKNTIYYLNLPGKQSTNFNFYSSFGRKIIPIDLSIGLNLNANNYENYTYTNSQLTASNSGVYSVSLSANKYVKDKYDFYVNFGPGYNISKSDIQTLNNNARTFNAGTGFNVYLPAKFQISSNITYNYTGKTQTFNTDQVKTIWNASLNKMFFKDRTLKLSITGNDLLNQNVNFFRSTNGNIISQNYVNVIQRYFMFSVTWDFNKMGGPTVNK